MDRVPALKNPGGAMTLRSASHAISAARWRARSERSPSARACSRQAIRRNRCWRWRQQAGSPNTSRCFSRSLCKLARRSFSISTNTAISILFLLFSVAVNHSHMNALWASTGKRIGSGNGKERQQNCLAFRAHRRDESGASGREPERQKKTMTTRTETQDVTAVGAEAGAPVTPQKAAAKKVGSRKKSAPKGGKAAARAKSRKP